MNGLGFGRLFHSLIKSDIFGLENVFAKVATFRKYEVPIVPRMTDGSSLRSGTCISMA